MQSENKFRFNFFVFHHQMRAKKMSIKRVQLRSKPTSHFTHFILVKEAKMNRSKI